MDFGIGFNFGPMGGGTLPSAPGLCVVRFYVLHNGAVVVGAHVHVRLEHKNPSVPTALLSRAESGGITNESGILDIEMIQFAQFTSGGVYRVTVSDPLGRYLHNRRVIVPSVDSIFAEELPGADA